MQKSEQTNELFTAIAKAQGEFRSIPMDKKNPHFKSSYASLTATQEGTREFLSKHGLALIQSIDIDGDGYYLETMLTHSSGQWASSRLKLILDKNNMQGLGSAITYAKRYAWQAMLGVVGDEDDDGNAAVAGKSAPTATAGKPAAQNQAKKPENYAPSISFHNPEEAGEYVIQIGRKYLGKKIKDIPRTELGGYFEYVVQENQKANRQATGHTRDFLNAVETWLSQF